MIEIKELNEKIELRNKYKEEIDKADPEGICFTDEDFVYYEKEGGIYSFRVYKDEIYCVCVVSIGRNFIKGFRSFILLTLQKYGASCVACTQGTSVEKYLKRHGYYLFEKMKDGRLLYYRRWRFNDE